jgi:hypothetical protein
MPLSLHESRRRSRRQRRSRVFSVLFILVLIGGAGYAIYAAGGMFAEREVVRLQNEIGHLKQSMAAYEERDAKMQTMVEQAAGQESYWKQMYERDVPTGPAKDLQTQLRARLSEGVTPARLSMAIGSVVNKPSCEDKPVTKRFIVRTPLHPGGNDSVGFADNSITVTAEGKITTADGAKLAAFDPAQPVTVSFTTLGGRKVETSGVLPIQYSVMTEHAEYKFNVMSAETRGFVTVTGDKCKAPAGNG